MRRVLLGWRTSGVLLSRDCRLWQLVRHWGTSQSLTAGPGQAETLHFFTRRLSQCWISSCAQTSSFLSYFFCAALYEKVAWMGGNISRMDGWKYQVYAVAKHDFSTLSRLLRISFLVTPSSLLNVCRCHKKTMTSDHAAKKTLLIIQIYKHCCNTGGSKEAIAPFKRRSFFMAFHRVLLANMGKFREFSG